jgi:hypothetical protein
VVREHNAARTDADGVRPGGNGGHQDGRNRSVDAWNRVVFGYPKAVVTQFLRLPGPFEDAVQGFPSGKPGPGVGTVENGNPGKGKGHTPGTTPDRDEFRVPSLQPVLAQLKATDPCARCPYWNVATVDHVVVWRALAFPSTQLMCWVTPVIFHPSSVRTM